MERNLINYDDEDTEDFLHTCSSDEKLKTGEVTLENPVHCYDTNNQMFN